MKSGKQRRAELDAKNRLRAEKAAQKRAAELRAENERRAARHLAVNLAALAPNNSYSVAEFVARGYYLDQDFDCVDCGASEVWTEAQQKWWYEVAKGDVFTRARRCRLCRRRERERRAEARRAQLEGMQRQKP